MRRLPICSRRTRFSSSKYWTTSCCRWFIQPAIETTRNENGSKPAHIAEGYHANDPVLPLRAADSRFWANGTWSFGVVQKLIRCYGKFRLRGFPDGRCISDDLRSLVISH